MQLFMPKKKPRIPPLTQKDIIVAQLDCRDSIDRTQQYREMIAKKHHPLDISSDEDAMTRVRTETQKLKLLRVDNLGVPYDLQKQITEENRLISELNSLNINFDPETDLHQMVQKMQKRVSFYTDKETKTADALEKLYKHFHSSTVEGRVSVDKASSNSQVLYEKIIETRKSYQELKQKLVVNSLKVSKLVLKSKNIESVLEIVEIWKQTLLGRLSEFNNNSNQEQNLFQMIRVVEEVKQSFKTQAKGYKGYECFLKMQQFLNKKKQSIIKQIESNYQKRIIYFDESRYEKHLQTYNRLFEQSIIPKKITLPVLLDRNLTHILKLSYKQTYNQDINSIKTQQYIQFITQLTTQIQKYCKNWHLATRWHIEYTNQNDKQQQALINQQGKQYLRFRKVIFQKIQERISDIVSKTYTFYRFTVVERAIFVLKLHKLLLEVSLFAREAPKLIGQVIKKKSKEERQIVEKGYQSWLKQLLIGQIRTPIFQIQNEPRPFHSGELYQFSEQQKKIIEQFQNNKLNINFQEVEVSPIVYAERKLLPINYASLPEISQFSSALLICQFTRQISKRIYFNSKLGVEMFNKLKQMLELQIISIYCGCCFQQIQKQLQQDWSKFPSIKISKYDEIEGNIAKIQYYKDCQRLQSEYYQLSVQIPYLLNKFPLNIPNTIVIPSLDVRGELLQNLSTAHKWLENNIESIFTNQMQKQQIESIKQQFRLLELLIKQLISIIYTNIIQETKSKYEGLASSVKDLKWEIKKYNNQTSEVFKAYKNNYFCIFQAQILSLKLGQMLPQIKKAIQTSLVNDFFKALVEAYSKIQKINSNGRQLMRLDALQLQQRIKGLGISTENTFIKHVLKFIQLGFEAEASKLQAGIKSQLAIFPFKVWKPFLVSCKASDQISWVQRRDVLLRLAQHYLLSVSSGRPK